MIAGAALGVGLIFLMAGVVGVLDAVRAASWRQVAAERRQRWEARQPEPAGADLRPDQAVAGEFESLA